jgi:hypothetical protein
VPVVQSASADIQNRTRKYETREIHEIIRAFVIDFSVGCGANVSHNRNSTFTRSPIAITLSTNCEHRDVRLGECSLNGLFRRSWADNPRSHFLYRFSDGLCWNAHFEREMLG